MGPGDVNDIMPESAEDLGDLRKVSELSFCLRRRRLTFGARRGLAAGAARGGGSRWKSQHRKIVYLSPYVEKPFNSKVIKFRTWTKKSLVFFCDSGFLCYVYMSYEHSMYISHIHVWLCNTKSNSSECFYVSLTIQMNISHLFTHS